MELVNSRVRFSWDVGAGGSLIEHDLPIESVADKLEEVDKWFKVEAVRYVSLSWKYFMMLLFIPSDWCGTDDMGRITS